MIESIWHMSTNNEPYRDLGFDYYERRDPDRTRQKLVRQLKSLGYNVTLEQAS